MNLTDQFGTSTSYLLYNWYRGQNIEAEKGKKMLTFSDSSSSGIVAKNMSVAFEIFHDLLKFLYRKLTCSPGTRFSKVPKPFRARKTISKTANRLFYKAGFSLRFHDTKGHNHLFQNFMPGNLFVFKIWRKLCLGIGFILRVVLSIGCVGVSTTNGVESFFQLEISLNTRLNFCFLTYCSRAIAGWTG